MCPSCELFFWVWIYRVAWIRCVIFFIVFSCARSLTQHFASLPTSLPAPKTKSSRLFSVTPLPVSRSPSSIGSGVIRRKRCTSGFEINIFTSFPHDVTSGFRVPVFDLRGWRHKIKTAHFRFWYSHFQNFGRVTSLPVFKFPSLTGSDVIMLSHTCGFENDTFTTSGFLIFVFDRKWRHEAKSRLWEQKPYNFRFLNLRLWPEVTSWSEVTLPILKPKCLQLSPHEFRFSLKENVQNGCDAIEKNGVKKMTLKNVICHTFEGFPLECICLRGNLFFLHIRHLGRFRELWTLWRLRTDSITDSARYGRNFFKTIRYISRDNVTLRNSSGLTEKPPSSLAATRGTIGYIEFEAIHSTLCIRTPGGAFEN